jgi:large subunit ribosomal protein L28
MSRQCHSCGKKKGRGNIVSHSNMKTKRDWKPNLQSVNIKENGKIMKVLVCTKCLKGSKVQKANNQA